MPFETLITPAELAPHLAEPGWAVVDCRFDLAQPAWGELAYRAGHIPGAVYAHLERDLSAPPTGANGRHPLPDLAALEALLGAWGIGPGVQVVAYDQAGGMYASRLWWLLRYLGHPAAAVLDGGWARWQREARPEQAGWEARQPTTFVNANGPGRGQPGWVVGAVEVERLRADPAWVVVDARAPERYRGETEPIDPVAGHIPGALNVYNQSLLAPAGTFLPPEALRQRWLAALGGLPAARVISYCGSGVAACQNLLALAQAGLGQGVLYAGSWSEWCADPARPVARQPG